MNFKTDLPEDDVVEWKEAIDAARERGLRIVDDDFAVYIKGLYLQYELKKAKQELVKAYLEGFSLALGTVPEDDVPITPPFNAEYILHILLRMDEREAVVGDLFEAYVKIVRRFNKRRADIWYYKQVACSLWPLLRRALFKIGALVWLGRILQRLIS